MKSFEINDFRPLTFVPFVFVLLSKVCKLIGILDIDYLNFTFRKQIILTYNKKKEREKQLIVFLSLYFVFI